MGSTNIGQHVTSRALVRLDWSDIHWVRFAVCITAICPNSVNSESECDSRFDMFDMLYTTEWE